MFSQLSQSCKKTFVTDSPFSWFHLWDLHLLTITRGLVKKCLVTMSIISSTKLSKRTVEELSYFSAPAFSSTLRFQLLFFQRNKRRASDWHRLFPGVRESAEKNIHTRTQNTEAQMSSSPLFFLCIPFMSGEYKDEVVMGNGKFFNPEAGVHSQHCFTTLTYILHAWLRWLHCEKIPNSNPLQAYKHTVLSCLTKKRSFNNIKTV